jgi:hypothetical protein
MSSKSIGDGVKDVVRSINAAMKDNDAKKGSFYVLIVGMMRDDTDHYSGEPASSDMYYATNVEDICLMDDILDDFCESFNKESRITQVKKRKAELGDSFIENWISE